MVTLRQAVGYAVICVCALVFCPLSILGNTIDVHPGEEIGLALSSAAAGDTVLVHCGTYAEQGLQMGSGVTLRSQSGDPACVRIESDGAEPILSCVDLFGVVRIEGITFTSAPGGLAAPVARGAGLYINNAAPLLAQCVFVDLEADYGGAVYCAGGAAPMFYACSFSGNSARAVGGAMNCVGSSAPTMAGCLFADNDAAGGGNAINAALGATPQIVTSTFANLGALAGASLVAYDGGAISLNNSILANGPYSQSWVGDYGAAPLISCSNLYAVDHEAWPGLLADMSGASGNLSADPLFCGDLGAGQPYTLDEISPCAPANSACGPMGAFPVACVNTTVTGIPEQSPLPQVSRLSGNYPNPFNPSTTIQYDVQAPGRVDIAIYDVAGRLIKRLVAQNMAAGSHQVQWHGADQADRPVSAGVYFIQLKTGTARDTKSVSLIK